MLGDRVRALGRRLAPHASRLQGLAIGVFLVVAFLPTLLEHLRASTERLTFADDARVLIPPLLATVDPTLFPSDPVVAYFAAGLPDGYRLLYESVGAVTGVVALSKALPILLLAVTLACLGLAAHRLGGKPALLGALTLCLGSGYVLGRMAGGLPRGFATPLMAAGALCLVSGRPVALAALSVVAAGFYPVVSALLGGCLFGSLMLPACDRGRAVDWSLRRRLLLLAATALGIGLMTLPALLRLGAYGPAIDSSLVAEYPEAGPFGRFDAMDREPFPALPMAALPPLSAALCGDGPALFWPSDLRAFGGVLSAAFGVMGLAGVVLLARTDSVARRFLVLPAAVIALHTLSLPLTPRLFLPERYVAYGVPVVALLAVPAAFAFVARASRRALRALPLAFNGLVLLLLGAHGFGRAGLTIQLRDEDARVYDAIGALPRSALVAGFPGLEIDNVPYLSERSAYVTWEMHMPFHVRHTELMRARMRKLIDAYFATDAEPLRFLERDGVTHLLFDRRHHVAPPGYFAPFSGEVAAAYAAGRASGFFLSSGAPRGVVFRTGSLELIDLSQL